MPSPEFIVEIDYTNWRGERGKRWIVPNRIAFESSQWHPEAQWVLHAYDVEKNAERSFAMKDIHDWTPVLTMLKQP
jgi:predicted DNA-binding transcriptional regulator YafY